MLQPNHALGTREKEQQIMKLKQKLLAVFAFVGLAIMPAFGQMARMPDGGKMSGKSTSANATAKKMAMCCMCGMNMGDMKMGKMMSGISAAEKKQMGKCCMAGMKAAGMKPGDMKMGKMMSGMSAAEKKQMGKCCMAGMKAAGMKMGNMKMGGGK